MSKSKIDEFEVWYATELTTAIRVANSAYLAVCAGAEQNLTPEEEKCLDDRAIEATKRVAALSQD